MRGVTPMLLERRGHLGLQGMGGLRQEEDEVDLRSLATATTSR